MIGIIKNQLTNTDKDYLAISSLNQLTYSTTNACIFCDSVDPSFQLPILTNMLQKVSAFSFQGILITDELSLAEELSNITYAKKRFLYPYHLDWTYTPNLQFTNIRKAFLNDNIELIARSTSHAQFLTNLFKPPKYIMPQWDQQVLIEINNNEK